MPNGDRQEWVNCQIDAEGKVIEEANHEGTDSGRRPSKRLRRG